MSLGKHQQAHLPFPACSRGIFSSPWQHRGVQMCSSPASLPHPQQPTAPWGHPLPPTTPMARQTPRTDTPTSLFGQANPIPPLPVPQFPPWQKQTSLWVPPHPSPSSEAEWDPPSTTTQILRWCLFNPVVQMEAGFQIHTAPLSFPQPHCPSTQPHCPSHSPTALPQPHSPPTQPHCIPTAPPAPQGAAHGLVRVKQQLPSFFFCWS